MRIAFAQVARHSHWRTHRRTFCRTFHTDILDQLAHPNYFHRGSNFVVLENPQRGRSGKAKVCDWR